MGDMDIFENVYGKKESDKVSVKILKAGDDFSMRVKDLLSYCKAVKQLLNLNKKNLTEKENEKDFNQKTKSFICSEELTFTANKNEIKESFVSRGCTVAKGSSLANSIVFPNYLFWNYLAEKLYVEKLYYWTA